MKKIYQLWNELMVVGPTNEDLGYIIKYVKPLRQEASRLLKRSRENIMTDIKNL